MAIVDWTSENMDWDDLLSPGHETPGRYMEALRQAINERTAAADLSIPVNLQQPVYPRAITGARTMNYNSGALGHFRGLDFQNQMDVLLTNTYINQNTFSVSSLPTIPYWNEADIIAEIGGGPRILLAQGDVPSKEWARQQYDMLNLLLWSVLPDGITTNPATTTKTYAAIDHPGETGNAREGSSNSSFADAQTDYDSAPSYGSGTVNAENGPEVTSEETGGSWFLNNKLGVVRWQDVSGHEIWTDVTSRIPFYAEAVNPGDSFDDQGTGLVEGDWYFLEELPLSAALDRVGTTPLIDNALTGSDFNDPGTGNFNGVQYGEPIAFGKWDQGTIGVDGFRYRI